MAANETNEVISAGSELAVRREKLATLKENGNDPFTITKYDVDAFSADIKADYPSYEGKTVRLAGRMMSRRIMGKASFANLADKGAEVHVEFADMGLPATGGVALQMRDVFTGETYDKVSDCFNPHIEAHDCKLYLCKLVKA